jgi:CDP-diacylglycerol--serine O-phosphatidyltransferase
MLVLELLTNPWMLVVITILSVYLLNAEIPLFSLKIKAFSLQKNALQIGFLVASLLLLVFFQYAGIPLVIVFYVLLSVANNAFAKMNKLA